MLAIHVNRGPLWIASLLLVDIKVLAMLEEDTLER